MEQAKFAFDPQINGQIRFIGDVRVSIPSWKFANIPGLLLILFFALIGRFYLKPAAEQFMSESNE